MRHEGTLLLEGNALMITLSVDPHPGSHTVAALDRNGATLANITVSNTAEGLSQLHQFAVPFARRRWAIEGAGNHFIAVFVGQLLERSEIVYSIPPSLTSQYRARRGRKKNDVIEAENVGRALLANPQLRPLHNAEQQRELQELTRAQRRLSEQLRANRGALQELMAESAVRKIIEQVIAVLLKQATFDRQCPSNHSPHSCYTDSAAGRILDFSDLVDKLVADWDCHSEALVDVKQA